MTTLGELPNLMLFTLEPQASVVYRRMYHTGIQGKVLVIPAYKLIDAEWVDVELEYWSEYFSDEADVFIVSAEVEIHYA
jgi:hypothetical protein